MSETNFKYRVLALSDFAMDEENIYTEKPSVVISANMLAAILNGFLTDFVAFRANLASSITHSDNYDVIKEIMSEALETINVNEFLKNNLESFICDAIVDGESYDRTREPITAGDLPSEPIGAVIGLNPKEAKRFQEYCYDNDADNESD